MSGLEKDVFGLCIIQSLNKDEMQTGSLLVEALLKYKKFQEEFLTLEYVEIESKEELWSLLGEYERKVRDEKWHVVFHIEAHGNTKGIVLSSGELVPWRELLNHLRPINILLKHYLVVHLGMCLGAWIASAIEPFQRAPFKAVVASIKEVGERDLLHAFTAFYDHYFFQLDPIQSVERMNETTSSEEPLFHLIVAGKMFDRIIDPEHDPENFKRIVLQSALSNYWPFRERHHIPFETFRASHEKMIRQDFKSFKAKKDYFIMKDLKS